MRALKRYLWLRREGFPRKFAFKFAKRSFNLRDILPALSFHR